LAGISPHFPLMYSFDKHSCQDLKKYNAGEHSKHWDSQCVRIYNELSSGDVRQLMDCLMKQLEDGRISVIRAERILHSVMAQVCVTIVVLQIMGLEHGDAHMQNFLYQEYPEAANERVIEYQFAESKANTQHILFVRHVGVLVIAWDFADMCPLRNPFHDVYRFFGSFGSHDLISKGLLPEAARRVKACEAVIKAGEAAIKAGAKRAATGAQQGWMASPILDILQVVLSGEVVEPRMPLYARTDQVYRADASVLAKLGAELIKKIVKV
jgi:hypothetical protein